MLVLAYFDPTSVPIIVRCNLSVCSFLSKFRIFPFFLTLSIFGYVLFKIFVLVSLVGTVN